MFAAHGVQIHVHTLQKLFGDVENCWNWSSNASLGCLKARFYLGTFYCTGGHQSRVKLSQGVNNHERCEVGLWESTGYAGMGRQPHLQAAWMSDSGLAPLIATEVINQGSNHPKGEKNMRDVKLVFWNPLGMLKWVVNCIFRLLEGQIQFWHL